MSGDVPIAPTVLSPFAFFVSICHVCIMTVPAADETINASDGNCIPQAGCRHADCVIGPFLDGLACGCTSMQGSAPISLFTPPQSRSQSRAVP